MATEVVSQVPCKVGEGPHWDPHNRTLQYVDIIGGDIFFLNPEFQEIHKIHTGEFVSFVIPRASNPDEVVIGRHLNLEILNTKTTLNEILVEVDPDSPKDEIRFNDAKCDAVGRLWAGTMFIGDLKNYSLNKGALYTLDKEHHFKKKITTSLSNGMAWTADNRTMFYIDSMLREVSAFSFDLDQGDISDRRTAINFKKFGDEYGYPDGMTIDVQGKLWISCFEGGRVVSCDPETGKLLREVQLPVSRVTSCCFGGPFFEDLYVTTASYGLSESELKQQPLAGHVFKVTNLGVQGSPAYEFAG